MNFSEYIIMNFYEYIMIFFEYLWIFMNILWINYELLWIYYEFLWLNYEYTMNILWIFMSFYKKNNYFNDLAYQISQKI